MNVGWKLVINMENNEQVIYEHNGIKVIRNEEGRIRFENLDGTEYKVITDHVTDPFTGTHSPDVGNIL